MKKLLLTITLITTIIFGGCSPDSNIKPTIDRTNKEIAVRVVFHENRNSLEEAYRTVNNLSERTPIPEQWGFAVWNQWKDREGNYVDLPGAQYQCVIHTFKPKNIDDQQVLTMGHELLHCVYGSYHN